MHPQPRMCKETQAWQLCGRSRVVANMGVAHASAGSRGGVGGPHRSKERASARILGDSGGSRSAAVSKGCHCFQRLGKLGILVRHSVFILTPWRVTGFRRTLPASGPWTWSGRWSKASDHPAWSRNEDGTPREVDLQHRDGRLALKAHRWGLRVAEHVAGGFKSEWSTNNSRWFEDWCERTHRRWCPDRVALPFWARWTRSGAVVYRNAVSSNLTTGVVDGSVRVKCVLKVL